MKFDCGPTYTERLEARRAAEREWRPWFAWFPVRLSRYPKSYYGELTHDCRWLEVIQRKGGRGYYEYKALEAE